MTAGRDGAAGWILAAALLLASPLPGLPAAQAQPGPDAHALPTAPATALPGNGTLASLARWIGLPALDGAAAVRSPLLGITLPAAGLAQAYQAKAAASPTPLRDAVLAWNQALALQPAAALVADPRLEDAASLPLPAQRAAATMLYALADATLLQREAVSHLTVGQYRALLAAPAAAVAGRFDPSVPDAAAAL
ncbi:MAG: hypothetical protein QOI63_604, partial [Thermoplasmata archaeon]|nr:hypothetical protein [Thermoplasmata archaeon]